MHAHAHAHARARAAQFLCEYVESGIIALQVYTYLTVDIAGAVCF